MNNKIKSNLVVLLRLAVGALFTASGFMKLVEPPANFTAVVRSYGVVGPEVSQGIASVFPWFEFIYGLFFLLGLNSRAALKSLWLMNMVFIFVVGQAKFRGLQVGDCGCFGEAFSLSLTQVLILDLCLWGILWFLWKSGNELKRWGLDSVLEKRGK